MLGMTCITGNSRQAHPPTTVNREPGGQALTQLVPPEVAKEARSQVRLQIGSRA